MSNMQQALIDAGLARQTLTPQPSRAAREGLPTWLTKDGVRSGPMSDFIETVHQRTYLIEGRGYRHVADVKLEGERLMVWFDHEVEPRVFRPDRRVRYAVLRGQTPARRAKAQGKKREKAEADRKLRDRMKGGRK